MLRDVAFVGLSTGSEGELVGVGWTRQALEDIEDMNGADEESEALGERALALAPSTRLLFPLGTPSEGAIVVELEDEADGSGPPDGKVARWRVLESLESSFCAFASSTETWPPSFAVSEQSI